MDEKFLKNSFQYIRGIEICIENKLTLPSLTLIYSGIDTFSWVSYGDKLSVCEKFTKWIENYMYKKKKLAPRPIDLYAARCAIVHTLTPESTLSKQNKALQICYASGDANLSELKKLVDEKLPGKAVCVHLNDLFESFKLGIVCFLETKGTERECQKRMSKHYARFDSNIISILNNDNSFLKK